MRYTGADSEKMVDDRNDYWMPMDQYIGGIEHAILHLLYARFWTKVMRDIGLVSFSEPFQNLLTQGMVLNETYYQELANGRKEWINPAEVDLKMDDKGRPIGAFLKTDQSTVMIGGIEKMAKSKNNGIDPQTLIDLYGADTSRLFTMFAAPPEQQLEWSDSGVEGAARFLRRLWNFAQTLELIHEESSKNVSLPIASFASRSEQLNIKNLSDSETTLRREVHLILKQANFDYARMQYNTVVSASMKLLNVIEQGRDMDICLLSEGFGILLRVLYPMVPHITYSLWQKLGYENIFGSITDAPWPKVDETALVQDELKLMLQVNGKLRGDFMVPASANKDQIEELALASEVGQRILSGVPIKKWIVVPGRLVNVVI